jgi:hypothetical protein
LLTRYCSLYSITVFVVIANDGLFSSWAWRLINKLFLTRRLQLSHAN